MSNKFKVTYANGVSEEVCDDAADAEAMAAKTFGSAWEAACEAGASVELIESVGAADDGAASDVAAGNTTKPDEVGEAEFKHIMLDEPAAKPKKHR